MAEPTGSTSEDQFLAQLEAMFSQGAGGAQMQSEIIGGFAPPSPPSDVGNPFLGQPGQNAPRGGRLSETERRERAPRGVELNPIYYKGMEAEILQAMNEEELGRFQDALIAAGLEREVLPGRLDDNTIRGMSTLMGAANRQAVSWQEVLDGVIAAGGMKTESGAGGGLESYRPPDYASIAQDVKTVFRNRLGREPDQAEMAELVGEIQGWDRQEEDAQIAAQPQIGPDGLPTSEPVEGTKVDPIARFQEEFDRRYSGELDFLDDKRSQQEGRASVQQTSDLASSMARGNF